MTNERDLESEIRDTLEGMAARPAPERLHARLALIPTVEPTSGALQPSSPSHSRLGFSLASAAIVTIVIVGALSLRGGGNGTNPSTPPTGASSVVAVTPAPTPSQSSSASSPTLSPSIVAVAPSPTPSATSVSPGAIPADFQPLSVTFVSADMGWVLGSTSCGANTCPVIVRTLDGGRTWTRIAAPETSIDFGGDFFGNDFQAGSGVTGLRFADPLDGWAFGPGLWATHDGGTTWKQFTIPGLPDGAVLALEASAGAVQLAAYDGYQSFRIASSPVSSDALRLSAVSVPVGAGPVPEVQLVLQGQTGWLLENDRVVTAGARLVAGTWQTWQPPCVTVMGPALLAAANAQDLIAACDVGLWATPQGEHLYRSTDAGQTFVETGPQLPVKGVTAIAAPSTSTIVAAGYGPNNAAEVVASDDGGHTWTVVPSAGQVGPFWVSYLGFTTAIQGVLLTSDGGGHGQLLMTRDAGHTWVPVRF
jgi:photosystem II stability/assembly factor-like uncharacterized protein